MAPTEILLVQIGSSGSCLEILPSKDKASASSLWKEVGRTDMNFYVLCKLIDPGFYGTGLVF